MIPEEIEPPMDLVAFQISPKTPHEQLKEFSNLHWTHEYKRAVAKDIVNNCKELLDESGVDWGWVLGNIRKEARDSVQYGMAAIAAYDARTIGALAIYSGYWSMHDPAIVYLSGKCLVNIASSESLTDFKNSMLEAAVDYGQKILSKANLYMATLDYLFEKDKGSPYRKKIAMLLGQGKIEEAYNRMNSRDDLVRTRVPDFSSSTTSSILTPPNPSI